MTSATKPDPVGCLVLLRLLPPGDKGESPTKIQKDLEPLLSHRWSGVPLSGALNHAIDDLKASGLVTFLLGKTRKAATKICLTANGHQRALEILGVAKLRPKTTWNIIRKTHLPALALNLPVSTDAQFKTISADASFRAILLKRQYNLPTAEVPKPDDAIDALVWKLIGFEGETRKFNVKNVKAAVLNRALGDGRATDFKKAANRLIARDTGARRDDSNELRDAIVRAWVARCTPADVEDAGEKPRRAGEGETNGSATTSPSALPTLVETETDLITFAERVKAAAHACPTGRYGDNKVFIAHVWKTLQSDPDYSGMTLDAFKHRLTRANNARLLDLGRADLIQAMDPEDIRLSEVHYLNATFHFVRI